MALQGFWRRLLAFPQCHGCPKQRRNLCYAINATVDTGISASKSPSELLNGKKKCTVYLHRKVSTNYPLLLAVEWEDSCSSYRLGPSSVILALPKHWLSSP